jgi:phage protein D
MTDALLSSTAPVFKVEGNVVGELARDLLRLEIDDSTDGLKRLRATLVAVGATPSTGSDGEALLHVDGSDLDFGKRLEVSIGAPGDERIVFSGLVSGIELDFSETDEPVVTAFAEDALMKLRMTRRLKTYEDMSDADIAQAIASEHGLSADADADGPSYDVVQQWNQSDLAFLRERATLIQAEVFADGDTLKFKSRGGRSGTRLTLIRGGELISVRLRADLAHQRTTVKVSGYDASARDRIEEEAGNDAIQAEANGGRSGPAVLQQALGERVSHRVRDVPLESGEARAFARAELLRRARSFVNVAGVTNGSPDMVVGSTLELQRVGAPFEGDGYYVTRVLHTYDLTSGHRTHFHAERPTINGGGS